MRTALLLLLSLTLASCAPKDDTPKADAGPETNATSVVSAFYQQQIKSPVSGAPSAEQLKIMAPYLSQELQAELGQARQLHDQEASAAPTKKPAFAEGDLFSSLFEGPTAFTILSENQNGDGIWVKVRFSYDKQDEKTQWTDNVRLTRENNRFVISDIEYQGSWDFANQDSLLSILKNSHAAAAAGAKTDTQTTH